MGTREDVGQGAEGISEAVVIVGGNETAGFRLAGELHLECGFRPGQTCEGPTLRRRKRGEGGVVFGLDVEGGQINRLNPSQVRRQ